MKKYIILSIASIAIILTSCTKEETIIKKEENRVSSIELKFGKLDKNGDYEKSSENLIIASYLESNPSELFSPELEKFEATFEDTGEKVTSYVLVQYEKGKVDWIVKNGYYFNGHCYVWATFYKYEKTGYILIITIDDPKIILMFPPICPPAGHYWV